MTHFIEGMTLVQQIVLDFLQNISNFEERNNFISHLG